VSTDLAPRLAPDSRDEFHPHNVPAAFDALGIPAEAREVIGHLKTVPWVWKAMLDELRESQARKAHFKIRIELVGSFGNVTDAEVELRRRARKPTT
jgi:hypothetical protein